MVRSAVFVVTFTINSVIFLPIVSRTPIGTSFCGQTSTTVREYATVLPTGILFQATKWIVLVHFSIFLAICMQVVQILLIIRFARGLLFCYFYDCIKLLYCNISPMSGSMTGLKRYQGRLYLKFVWPFYLLLLELLVPYDLLLSVLS